MQVYSEQIYHTLMMLERKNSCLLLLIHKGEKMSSTTFFFSHFPLAYGEYDLWKIFARWGRVIDVFISQRLNRWGQRFGFVRFLGVNDSRKLESQLDNIRIGNWKLHVNLPKYRRHERIISNGRSWKEYQGDKSEHNQGLKGKQEVKKVHKVWKRKTKYQTYAQVVKGVNMGREDDDQWKGIEIRVAEEKEWLEKSFVGRLQNMDDLEKLKESFMLNGMGFIHIRYLGDNAVLLTWESKEDALSLIEANKAWLETVFESIVHWENHKVVGNNIRWARIWGVPISLWSRECFEKIIATMGTVVDVDMKTTQWQNLEYARVQVRLPLQAEVRMKKTIKINGVLCPVVVEQELALDGNKGCYSCRKEEVIVTKIICQKFQCTKQKSNPVLVALLTMNLIMRRHGGLKRRKLSRRNGAMEANRPVTTSQPTQRVTNSGTGEG